MTRRAKGAAPSRDQIAAARRFLAGESIATIAYDWVGGVPAVEGALRAALQLRTGARASRGET